MMIQNKSCKNPLMTLRSCTAGTLLTSSSSVPLSFLFCSVFTSVPLDGLFLLPSLLTLYTLHKFTFSPPHSFDNSHLYFRVHLKCQFHTALFVDPHPLPYSFGLGLDLWLHILIAAHFSLFIALTTCS